MRPWPHRHNRSRADHAAVSFTRDGCSGVDGIPDAVQAVADGRMIASYFQDAERQMTRALELAVMAARGEALGLTDTIDGVSVDWIPFRMITPANYRDFQ
jgi:inositol transport system substrate-binding protein